MSPILLSIATLLSTLGGGLLALKFRDDLHYILGFTAGVLLGVVSFDVLPEIFELAHEHQFDASGSMIALVVGFILFHSLEKFLLVHPAHEQGYKAHHHPHAGLASAAALAGHSFMDGVGIGLGFQVSPTVGVTVAMAVIAHDFSDGLNTVTLMLRHHNTTRKALLMLALDAIAPVLGVAATLFLHIPPYWLMVYLGFFAGFLLYIGVADILPEAHSGAKPATSVKLIALTCLGAAFVYTLLGLMR
jgi:ZIP family zinc transporter